jgi:hypothetical protein
MSKTKGFGFSEEDARVLVARLERCLSALQETIEFVEANYEAKLSLPYKQAIGKAIANISLDVLEAGLYCAHPHLFPRPAKGQMRLEEQPQVDKSLDLTQVSLTQLLTEALYRGKTGFLDELIPYEPISVSAIDAELARRSGTESRKYVADWVVWYLASDQLSDADKAVIALVVKNKGIFEKFQDPKA